MPEMYNKLNKNHGSLRYSLQLGLLHLLHQLSLNLHKLNLIHTLSEDTIQSTSLLSESDLASGFTPFSGDRLRLVFLPSVRTALHAEARCDKGSVTYNITDATFSLH